MGVEGIQRMGKTKNDRRGGEIRPDGPSQITYALAGVPDDPGGPQTSMEDLPPERRKKIERIRKEIQGGKYETREKLEKAIERLLKEIL